MNPLYQRGRRQEAEGRRQKVEGGSDEISFTVIDERYLSPTPPHPYTLTPLHPYALFLRSLAIFRWLIVLVLVWGLTSCGEKSLGQEVSAKYQEQQVEISRQFAETSPPAVIQALRSRLEIYRPQVKIVTPLPDEIINDNQVTVQLQVKDLPVFKHPQWELGSYIHLIVDNKQDIAIYDPEKPLAISDLSPGTHTLRVFASRPWHESFKNEGAYAQTTFHLFTKTDDNNPDRTLPLLTYNHPQGSYGAEPILLDFYLTNAPLHLNTQDHTDDIFSDWRIRCTINGESFVLDRWQSVYLKGFKPGINWVKLEFLDNQGNPVKNAFNTTVKLVNYQPKGKDTLSRITRGELTAEEVRGIVDPDYVAKPTTTPEIPPETPQPTTSPTTTPTPEISPPPQPSPSVVPTTPEVFESPLPEPQPEVTPTPSPSVTEQPQPKVTPTPLPSVTEPPQPEATPTPLPSITEPPQPEVTPTPSPSVTEPPQPEVTPTPLPSVTEPPQPEITPTPSPSITEPPQPEVKETESPTATVKKSPKINLGKYFQRRSPPSPAE